MAFNKNDPADLLALKNEATLDPLGMGYNILGGTQDILDLFNTPASNLGSETGPDFLTTGKFLTIVFAENVSAGDQFRIQLLYEMTEGDVNIDKHRTDIAVLNDIGINNAIAALTRPLSRADFLFGDIINGAHEIVNISSSEWFAARDS